MPKTILYANIHLNGTVLKAVTQISASSLLKCKYTKGKKEFMVIQDIKRRGRSYFDIIQDIEVDVATKIIKRVNT